MHMPIVSVNGTAICNFNIPYSLTFDTGDTLDAVSSERAEALKPSEKVNKFYANSMASLWRDFDIQSPILSYLLSASQEADIILVTPETLKAIHYKGMFGKFNKLRTYRFEDKDCMSSTEFYARY